MFIFVNNKGEKNKMRVYTKRKRKNEMREVGTIEIKIKNGSQSFRVRLVSIYQYIRYQV